MNFVDLRYIQAIAVENSITKAAQNLFISQPSLSQRVQKIEAELGHALFIRTPSGLKLTEAGQQFVEMSDSVLKQYDTFRRNLDSKKISRLVIGLSPRENPLTIPKLLDAFSHQHPETKLEFQQFMSFRLEERLLEGEIDFAVLHTPVLASELTWRTIHSDYFQIYLRKGSNLDMHAQELGHAPFPALSLELLQDEPIGLTTPGQRTRATAELILHALKTPPHIAYEMPNYDSLYALADAGHCTLLVPQSYCQSYKNRDTDRIFSINTDRYNCSTRFDSVLAYNSARTPGWLFDEVYKILHQTYAPLAAL